MLGLAPEPDGNDDNDEDHDSEPEIEMDGCLYDPRTMFGLEEAPSKPPQQQRQQQQQQQQQPKQTDTSPHKPTLRRPLPDVPVPARSSRHMPLPPTPSKSSSTPSQPSSARSSTDAGPPPLPARPSLRRKKAAATTPVASDDAASLPGFMGAINRDKAEATLRMYPPGAYLIRTSKSVNGYVISANTTPGRHVHVKVTRTRNGGVATLNAFLVFNTLVQTDQSFPDMPTLVSFYKEHTIHSGIALGVPVQTH
ncbi:hypothetical protein PTSG_05646 [Salpingoeca rosetta]|uniref:SH2 domain-containing protein n=1 Tax=Salpingoeca rosetta (strain ATCC 50818 / BSB-021) TaxID=946362 RepID=F2UBT5_SALR5|nr:uncharacterized protein PTSG_05646 [Salpingoeca rosetta]EGD73951.1 hypothetical protein PTSG_05646 [Salpingoeca rosetta]|eukprot:XP_004993514.1 hypothetical protein PTSG_05646 [Salpingoeca rosetta]